MEIDQHERLSTDAQMKDTLYVMKYTMSFVVIDLLGTMGVMLSELSPEAKNALMLAVLMTTMTGVIVWIRSEQPGQIRDLRTDNAK